MQSDNPIDLIFDHAWLLLIFGTLINAAILWARSRPIVKKHSELAEGYKRLLIGFVLFMNLPWLVMGVGIIFGDVPGTFDYFPPAYDSLFVVAFYVTILILWLLGFWWVYFRGGAEFLVTYRGLFNRDFKSPREVKILSAFFLLSYVIVLFLLSSG
jgi:hypothetical protein